MNSAIATDGARITRGHDDCRNGDLPVRCHTRRRGTLRPNDGPLGLEAIAPATCTSGSHPACHRYRWGRLGKAFADFGRMLLILGPLIILALVVNQIDFKGRFIGYTDCELQPTPDCK